jgi:hypothetical protein
LPAARISESEAANKLSSGNGFRAIADLAYEPSLVGRRWRTICAHWARPRGPWEHYYISVGELDHVFRPLRRAFNAEEYATYIMVNMADPDVRFWGKSRHWVRSE